MKTIENENEKLKKELLETKEKLEKAKIALEYYADPDTYERYEYDGLTSCENDGGDFADKTLKEIEG